MSAGFSAAAVTVSLRVDLQAAAGPLHRQRGRTHAETGGAGRPASCPLQAHLPTVLPRFASLPAGLPQKSGTSAESARERTTGAGGKRCGRGLD